MIVTSPKPWTQDPQAPARDRSHLVEQILHAHT